MPESGPHIGSIDYNARPALLAESPPTFCLSGGPVYVTDVTGSGTLENQKSSYGASCRQSLKSAGASAEEVLADGRTRMEVLYPSTISEALPLTFDA